MHRRRTSARTARVASVGALLIAAPLLSSCGFDYATDRVNTISAGTNDRSGQIDVLGAVVVAKEPNAGAFVATLVNNSNDDADQLTSVGDQDGSITTIGGLETYPIPPRKKVSLIQKGGVPISGTFGVGNFIDVTLTFESGQITTVHVPVVRPCNQYSPEKLPTLSVPTAPAGEAAAEPADTDGSAEDSGEPDPYSCEAYESTVAPDGRAPSEGEAEDQGANSPAGTE